MWLEVSRSELSDVIDLLPEISPLLAIGQAQLYFDGTQLVEQAPGVCITNIVEALYFVKLGF